MKHESGATGRQAHTILDGLGLKTMFLYVQQISWRFYSHSPSYTQYPSIHSECRFSCVVMHSTAASVSVSQLEQKAKAAERDA